MEKTKHLFRTWILFLGFLTFLSFFLFLSPIQVALPEMIFVVFSLVFILYTSPSERWLKLSMPVSGIYWLSALMPGYLGAILSFSGLGLAFILALCLENLVRTKRNKKKSTKTPG